MDEYFEEIENFFTPYFKSCEETNKFIDTVYKIENENLDDNNIEISEADEVFLTPRRMINTVVRFVTVSEDMEKIRPGQDTYKIVYIVSCIERLNMLSGCIKEKWEMVRDFIEQYFSDSDKQEILEKFHLSNVDIDFENAEKERISRSQKIDNDIMNKIDNTEYDDIIIPSENINIQEFAAIINVIRNHAMHNGEFWDVYFQNGDINYDLFINIKINRITFKTENQIWHTYETRLSFNRFKIMFIHACITYILKYCSNFKESRHD